MAERKLHPEISAGLGACVVICVAAAAALNEWAGLPVAGAAATWLAALALAAGFAASSYLGTQDRLRVSHGAERDDQPKSPEALPNLLDSAQQAPATPGSGAAAGGARE